MDPPGNATSTPLDDKGTQAMITNSVMRSRAGNRVSLTTANYGRKSLTD
jgi:hypothetical protein